MTANELSGMITETAAAAGVEAVFSVWFLLGAAMVFFMQCGFAMLEAGLGRSKNVGNILMKNLVDFGLGALAFVLLGFSLMCSADYISGLIGMPNLDIFTNYAKFDWSTFVFNLVFCATASTIVSGAVAERTKFSTYCLYSIIISAVVYPIEAGWIWNENGWLAQMGFIDFAGSTAIHMVGGISAFIGAAMVGARIGKYGKDGKAKAIPGHNLVIACLGAFILWFGWYGFNGAAATNVDQLSSIFLTTTLAPAFGSIAAMFLTWVKNGKPDVSMTLNGALAGLVGITAGCSHLDAIGAIIVGVVGGILVVFAVEIIDQQIKVDDPVGAVAVHCVNGVWGTLAVGLFSVDGGLFYGGGAKLLGIQALGVLTVAAYTIVVMLAVFFILKKTIGLRVSREEEIMGLDIAEHGIISTYADILPSVTSTASLDDPSLKLTGNTPVKDSVPVQLVPSVNTASDVKLTKIDIVLKQSKLEELKEAMDNIGITGMTVTQVLGCGVQKGKAEYYRGVPVEINLLPKIQVEIVVCRIPVETVIETAIKALYTGHIGDGKIFVYNVEDVIKVRTGERGCDALQDVE